MAISEQGKKIWKSEAGGSLMRAMLGTKPMTEQDRQTLEQLKQTGQMTAEQMHSQPTAEGSESSAMTQHRQPERVGLHHSEEIQEKARRLLAEFPEDCPPLQTQTLQSLSNESTDGLPQKAGKVGGGLIGSAPFRCLTPSIMQWIDSMTPQERESFYSETSPRK